VMHSLCSEGILHQRIKFVERHSRRFRVSPKRTMLRGTITHL
jgi:hypothetical protein